MCIHITVLTYTHVYYVRVYARMHICTYESVPMPFVSAAGGAAASAEAGGCEASRGVHQRPDGQEGLPKQRLISQ